MDGIDPIEFGKVLARLEDQDKQLDALRRDNSEMRQDIKALLGMANRGKGALFILMGVSSIVGAVVGEIAHLFLLKGH